MSATDGDHSSCLRPAFVKAPGPAGPGVPSRPGALSLALLLLTVFLLLASNTDALGSEPPAFGKRPSIPTNPKEETDSPCDHLRRDTACAPARLVSLPSDQTVSRRRPVGWFRETGASISVPLNPAWLKEDSSARTELIILHELGHVLNGFSPPAAGSDSLLTRRVEQGLKRAKVEDELKRGVITQQQYSRIKSSLMREEAETLKAYASRDPDSSATRLSVAAVQFSPDGKFIATAGEGGVLKLWDVQSGEVIGTNPPALQQWLTIADSRLALERLSLSDKIDAREYELGAAALALLEDQVARALPLSLDSVVFTLRLTTAAGLKVVRDYDVHFDPQDFIPRIIFFNERPPAAGSFSESARNWFLATAGILSAVCAAFTVVINRRKQRQDEEKEEQEKQERVLRIKKLEYDLLPEESPPAKPERSSIEGPPFVNATTSVTSPGSTVRGRTIVLLSTAGGGKTITVVATFADSAAPPHHRPGQVSGSYVV
jgi:hypothetical protein